MKLIDIPIRDIIKENIRCVISRKISPNLKEEEPRWLNIHNSLWNNINVLIWSEIRNKNNIILRK